MWQWRLDECYALVAEARHENRLGTVHGGAIMTFADPHMRHRCVSNQETRCWRRFSRIRISSALLRLEGRPSHGLASFARPHLAFISAEIAPTAPLRSQIAFSSM